MEYSFEFEATDVLTGDRRESVRSIDAVIAALQDYNDSPGAWVLTEDAEVLS